MKSSRLVFIVSSELKMKNTVAAYYRRQEKIFHFLFMGALSARHRNRCVHTGAI